MTTYVLWSLTKKGRRMRAELDAGGRGAVQLRIVHDGQVNYVQQHYRLDLALHESAWLRREFEAAGWLAASADSPDRSS